MSNTEHLHSKSRIWSTIYHINDELHLSIQYIRLDVSFRPNDVAWYPVMLLQIGWYVRVVWLLEREMKKEIICNVAIVEERTMSLSLLAKKKCIPLRSNDSNSLTVRVCVDSDLSYANCGISGRFSMYSNWRHFSASGRSFGLLTKICESINRQSGSSGTLTLEVIYCLINC